MTTLEETARRVGHYRWVEMRTFEILGRWVPSVPEHRVKERLAGHSRKHGWHAELWRERLPAPAGSDPDALTAPPDEAFAAFLDALAAPAGPGSTVERLVGVYRVLLPHKIEVYTGHLERAVPVAGGPTVRWLRFVLQDELEDRHEGELLLRGLLDEPARAERAAAHQGRLEELLAGSVGMAGPVAG